MFFARISFHGSWSEGSAKDVILKVLEFGSGVSRWVRALGWLSRGMLLEARGSMLEVRKGADLGPQ
jgi:hypothetical protein